jgi:hypothetical protein
MKVFFLAKANSIKQRATLGRLVIFSAAMFFMVRTFKPSAETQSDFSAIGDPLEKDMNHVGFENVFAGRQDVLSRSKDYFTYETPFVDLEKIATYKNVFDALPSDVFPPPSPTMVDIWNQMYPFALEYIKPEDNGAFNPCDTAVLYAFVRHRKPRRVFEVGSGFSTRAVKDAITKNYEDTGIQANHLCIEPYRAEVLKDMGVEVIVKPIQEVDLKVFDELDSGDILFLDNSHVLKPYGDVIFEFLWILPRLKPGVHVHVHDIFLPHGYPEIWIAEQFRPYTEQYMLAAFLHNNNAWNISFLNNGQLYKVSGADEQSLKSYQEDDDSHIQIHAYTHTRTHTNTQGTLPWRLLLSHVCVPRLWMTTERITRGFAWGRHMGRVGSGRRRRRRRRRKVCV